MQLGPTDLAKLPSPHDTYPMDLDVLPPTDDWIFKLPFGDLLKSFVELPDEEYDLIYLDPHLKRERKEDKLGILDVKVRTKTGKIVHIEIQVEPIFPEVKEHLNRFRYMNEKNGLRFEGCRKRFTRWNCQRCPGPENAFGRRPEGRRFGKAKPPIPIGLWPIGPRFGDGCSF